MTTPTGSGGGSSKEGNPESNLVSTTDRCFGAENKMQNIDSKLHFHDFTHTATKHWEHMRAVQEASGANRLNRQR